MQQLVAKKVARSADATAVTSLCVCASKCRCNSSKKLCVCVQGAKCEVGRREED